MAGLIKASVGSFKPALGAIERKIARIATEEMAQGTADLQGDYRDQVRAAGLGNKVAGAWQKSVYPSGEYSLDPAGYVYSKTPAIIMLFATGGTIVPVNGHPFLAIPTKNVPRSPGSRGKRRMTPAEVETTYNQDLIIRRGKRGNLLAYVSVARGLNKQKTGFRRPTKGRLAQGASAELVLMFTLVRRVVARKLLDLNGPAQVRAKQVADRIAQRVR